jgi:phosphoglycerol transferase MdoB-like AlkP superfamily enzyme
MPSLLNDFRANNFSPWIAGTSPPWPRHLRFSAPFDNDLGLRWLSSLILRFAHPIFVANSNSCLILRALFKPFDVRNFLILRSAYIHVVQVVLRISCSSRGKNFQAVPFFLFSEVIHEDEPRCRLPFQGMDDGSLLSRYRKVVCR